MQVIVGQSWNDRLTVQIDDVGVRTREFSNRGVRPDRGELAAGNRYRFGDRKACVDGDDMTVDEDAVDWDLRARGQRGGNQQRCDRRDDPQP